MTAIFFDSPMDDASRRRALYHGNLFVFSPRPSAVALAAFAREMLAEAFRPYDPRAAQHHLPVEAYAAILARLKPAFIHHPRSKELVRGILAELGCDPDKTYFDVPRLRSATSSDYLTTGIAYAFHPHRDTWYSAPQCQLNHWFPVYNIEPDNGMAFHLHYWSRPLKNSSRIYNYYRWNKDSRASAARHIGTDTRPQPKAEEAVELDPQLRVIAEPGGVLIFSGAQLHSTVPNTSGVTRFSIDFRTVHFDDIAQLAGAPNLDSQCTGTALRDFLRASDLARLPEELIRPHDRGGIVEDGVLVYEPG